MPSPASFPRRSPEERKKAILSAALRILKKKNFHEISMEEISKAAGVAKGTAYLYFKTKEDLFAGLVQTLFQSVQSRWKKAWDHSPPGNKRLQAIVRSQLEFFEDNRGFFSQIFQGTLPPAFLSARKRAEIVQANIRVLAQGIQEAVQKGELRKVDVEQASIALFGLIRGCVFARLIANTPGRLPDRMEFIWSCFYKGMKPSQKNAKK